MGYGLIALGVVWVGLAGLCVLQGGDLVGLPIASAFVGMFPLIVGFGLVRRK